jgi:hypothetical protein
MVQAAGYPHPVGPVATGETFDAIVVAADVGRAALAVLRDRHIELGPVILDRCHRSVGFLISPQGDNVPTVNRRRSLPRRLGRGSWITFPSSPEQPDARLVWLVRPDGHRWHTSEKAVEAAIDTTRTSPAHANAVPERNLHTPLAASTREPTAYQS